MKFAKKALALSSVLGIAHCLPAISSIPSVRRVLFPNLLGVGKSGHVALTFDDGPDHKSTPLILEILDEYNWKATFFLLGIMVKREPDLAAEILSRGHEIGVHGFEHNNHLYRTLPAVISDVRRAYDVIVRATGTAPTWFRPPYGILSSSSYLAAKMNGLRPILWTTWGLDWEDCSTPETILSQLSGGLSAQDHLSPLFASPTLLLHDSDCTSEISMSKATIGSLTLLSDWARKNSIQIGALRDHFK